VSTGLLFPSVTNECNAFIFKRRGIQEESLDHADPKYKGVFRQARHPIDSWYALPFLTPLQLLPVSHVEDHPEAEKISTHYSDSTE
jgi:hypothetical protein